MGGGWSAASEPSMTTIGTEIGCEDQIPAPRLTSGALIIWEQSFHGEVSILSTHEEEDFHLSAATGQCQKMTNFKLTLLSLFLKQINHYNNKYRRVSEPIQKLNLDGFLSLTHKVNSLKTSAPLTRAGAGE